MGYKTGTYDGDNGATQSITGVGFQPTAVIIFNQDNFFLGDGVKTDQDGLNADSGRPTAAWDYTTDMIISLDPDGFTVGDGSSLTNTFNRLGTTYTYIAFSPTAGGAPASGTFLTCLWKVP